MKERHFFIPHIIVIAGSVALFIGIFLFCSAVLDVLIPPIPRLVIYNGPALAEIISKQEKTAVLGEKQTPTAIPPLLSEVFIAGTANRPWKHILIFRKIWKRILWEISIFRTLPII